MTAGPNWIKRARIDAKLTQQELARQLGVCRSALTHWEAGLRIPRREHVIRIAQITSARGACGDEMLRQIFRALPLRKQQAAWQFLYEWRRP